MLKGSVSKSRKIVLALALLFSLAGASSAVIQRFPKPDFESGYTRPVPETPEPRSMALESLDVVVLLLALSLASYFALKLRSRVHLFVLMLFSLLYFGFWRKGCVCSIGAIQNVSYTLFNSSYAIPWTALAFFTLPLIFTLFFGRTFCAAVCPLGALQDVVILRPRKVPRPLAHALSLLPYLYLGLAVLYAAAGAGFLICRYDPFVGFFRFGANFNMVLFGASLLLLGTVIARPYCRFLCPYAVLLNWMSRLSRRHVSITPAECINCRLCEESCPFDAIRHPVIEKQDSVKERAVRRLGWIVLLTPVVVFAGAWIGSSLGEPLSKGHFTVSLAEAIVLEEAGLRSETSEETDAFRTTGVPIETLLSDARRIQDRFRTGGGVLGAFFALIFSVKLINLNIRRRNDEYSADTGTCLSCGRCFAYCPVGAEGVDLEELKRLSP